MHIKKNWLYISYILVGFLMIFTPQFAALASIAFEVVLGWILTCGAIIQLVFLISHRAKLQLSAWLLPLCLLIVGLYFLLNPLSAAAVMVWLFAGLSLLSGISSLAQGILLQGLLRTAFIINGVIGIVFALIIWLNWPYSGQNFIGMLLGIQLVMSGIARLAYRK